MTNMGTWQVRIQRLDGSDYRYDETSDSAGWGVIGVVELARTWLAKIPH